MKIDKKATEAARARHREGEKRLQELFRFTPAHTPFVPQNGRPISSEKKVRRIWRSWRDSMVPKRAAARAKRKTARASRKRNRR